MSSKRWVPSTIAMSFLIVLLIATAKPTSAGDPDKNRDTVPTTTLLVSKVEDAGGGGPEPGPPTTVNPCRWVEADRNVYTGAMDMINDIHKEVVAREHVAKQAIGERSDRKGAATTIAVKYYISGGKLYRWDPSLGSSSTLVRVKQVCHGAFTGVLGWRAVAPPSDPTPLRKPAYDLATAGILTPNPKLSPERAVSVNFGVWLFAESYQPGPVIAKTANAWWRTEATVDKTYFDMGNGDVIECHGEGDEWKENIHGHVQKPSPKCGYMYTTKEDADNQELVITITTRYKISWTNSNGQTGTDPDICRTTILPYNVYEIQTVGGAPPKNTSTTTTLPPPTPLASTTCPTAE